MWELLICLLPVCLISLVEPVNPVLLVLFKELVLYGEVENMWFGLTRKTTVQSMEKVMLH